LASTRLIAGVVRKPTEDTTAGSVAVACTTHQVPNGLATSPIYASAAHDTGCVPMPPCGACQAISGSSIAALTAKHHGINSNIVERGGASRVAMIATDHDSEAASRNAWPISTLRDDQSIAHGLISTTAPASPNAAASQRPGGMRSRRNTSDSGTTQ